MIEVPSVAAAGAPTRVPAGVRPVAAGPGDDADDETPIGDPPDDDEGDDWDDEDEDDDDDEEPLQALCCAAASPRASRHGTMAPD